MPAIHERDAKRAAALPEHSRVRLLHAVSKVGLARGAAGTIVHVYDEGGYEVDFIEGRKRPAVLTVEPDEIEPLNGE